MPTTRARRGHSLHSLYGVSLRSRWRLPFPNRSDSKLAHLSLEAAPPSFFADALERARVISRPRRWFRWLILPDKSTYLRWRGLFEFIVTPDGRKILARQLPEGTRAAFQTYLLNHVLSLALLRQGLESLHSTAVVINGKAVAFLGDCGYGKSSLGAAFVGAGYRLLTDDLLVITRNGKGFSAYPGMPRIKLFPRVAQHILGKSVRGTPMNNLTAKLVVRLAERESQRGAVPLGAIYVLRPPRAGRRTRRVRIGLLSERGAFVALLKNTFNTFVVEPQRLRRQFALSAQIASGVPVKTLSYPRILEKLPAVRDAVLSDLAR